MATLAFSRRASFSALDSKRLLGDWREDVVGGVAAWLPFVVGVTHSLETPFLFLMGVEDMTMVDDILF